MNEHPTVIVHYTSRNKSREYIVIITDGTDAQEYVEPGYAVEQSCIVDVLGEGLTTFPTDKPLREVNA